MLAFKRRSHDSEDQLLFKDRIMAMLAHDLRNPLAALSLAIETLEQHQARLSPELTLQLLGQARSQTRVMDQMITDILQGARGAATELTLQAVEFQLVELCQAVVSEFRSRIEAKELRLRVDLPSQLPTVNADLEKIRQVLTNLIDNAVKYTPPQGEIGITALHRTKQKIQITISDTGPGIPAEAQERIFSDRVRLSSDQDGYGIGLALCRQIMRAHYGRIWVDSRSGEGSRFHFTLPVFRV